MAEIISRLEKLYDDYLTDMGEGDKGLHGLRGTLNTIVYGNHSGDSCTIRFAEEVKAEIDALAASQPSGSEAQEVIDFVLERSARYGDKGAASMMFTAVHGYLAPLTAYIDGGKAAACLAAYDAAYPKRVRTPKMNEFRSALASRSKK